MEVEIVGMKGVWERSTFPTTPLTKIQVWHYHISDSSQKILSLGEYKLRGKWTLEENIDGEFQNNRIVTNLRAGEFLGVMITQTR